MEENEPLFALSVDDRMKDHLKETTRWARLLAFAGFAFLLIILMGGIYRYIAITRFNSVIGSSLSRAGSSLLLSYLLIVAVSVFPLLYMLKFSSKMKIAFETNDQEALIDGFMYLKIYFRYIGILIILSLVLFALTFFIGVVGSATL